VGRGGHLPASFAQARLWFLDQWEPGSPAYNIAAAVRLAGPLFAPALARALNEIVRRHEALRTRFAAVDGQPVQVIAPRLEVPLPVVDLGALPESEREPEARRRAREEALRPFDLAHGPLLRASLLRLGDREHVVLLTMHHIVADGWSMGVLVRELRELYEAFRRGLPSPLPELSIQYADYAAWQRRWLRGQVLRDQLAYWRGQLAGVPPLELPTDRPRPAAPSRRGGERRAVLPAALAGRVRALALQEGATPFVVLLAAFQALLHRYSGQDDFAVGTPIAGRTRSEVEGLIGLFINTLVLRADLSGGPTFRELVRRARRTALGAFAHQDVPFEQLVGALQPERGPGLSPFFQVMFVLQNAPLPEMSAPGLTLTPLEVDAETAKFDLTLVLAEGPGPAGLRASAQFDADLFDPPTIERLLGHFRTLLEGALAEPDRPVAALSMLSEAERQQLLRQWNETGDEPEITADDPDLTELDGLSADEIESLMMQLSTEDLADHE
jgi:hypothetical protein